MLLLIGLVLIVKGGDLFVRAAVATAEALRLPRVVVGATVLLFLVGAAMVVFGSRLLVANAVLIASAMVVPPLVIGLTVVAVGTSLPELVTAVLAARQGVADLSVSNLIGANIANWTLVAGAAGVLSPIPVDGASLALNGSALAVIMAAVAYFAFLRRRLDLASGVFLVGIYAAYLVILLATTAAA